MRLLLKLEELAQLALGIYLFSQLSYSWWWFLVLFLTPDLGMLGYLVNAKWGALTYNLCHHKAIAIGSYLFGIWIHSEWIMLSGTILFAHAAFDRLLGYGLKYQDHFKHTHLSQDGPK